MLPITARLESRDATISQLQCAAKFSILSTERLLQLVKLCAAQIHDLQIDIACSLARQMHRCTGCKYCGQATLAAQILMKRSSLHSVEEQHRADADPFEYRLAKVN